MHVWLSVCLLLALAPRAAHAQVELLIDAQVKEHELLVNPAQQTTLKFDAEIKRFMHHDWGDRTKFYI